jgi:hypothetical protein
MLADDKLYSVYLFVAFICEFDTMIGDNLMNFAVLVALALGVADEDDELHSVASQRGVMTVAKLRILP